MLTERFEYCRKNRLAKILDATEMKRIWKKEIRNNLRKSILQDFHDYHDFHEQIDDNIVSLKERVLKGVYAPKRPLWFKEEKKLGVSRLLALPSPEDALLFQTITDHLSKDLKDIQPVSNVYFSQLRHAPKPGLHEIDNENGYTRSKLYQKFTKSSLGFAKAGRYVVSTDLSNFFDSVLTSDLRHVVSHWFTHHEVELDLLFKMIEAFTLCPDYLPPRGRGIPTIDLDAPRFLGHVYLFEVDKVMDKLTKSNYTRWMDDIVFAANTYGEAKEILGKLNDLLRSRGLSLNLQKTAIHTSKSYFKSVMYDENKYLDTVFGSINTKSITSSKRRRLKTKWKRVLAVEVRPRTWDKVIKRYLGAIKKSNSTFLDSDIAEVFFECPTARDSLCDYLSHRGFNIETMEQVKRAFKSPSLSEDSALIHLVTAISMWDVPYTLQGRTFLRYIDGKLFNFTSDVGRYAHVFFRTAHGSRLELYNLVKQNFLLVSGDSFYARQLLCCLPLIWNEDRDWCEKTLKSSAYDRPSTNSKLAQRLLAHITGSYNLKNISDYLFFNLKSGTLKHSKLIFLSSCLVGPNSSNKDELLSRAFDNIKNNYQLEFILRVLDD